MRCFNQKQLSPDRDGVLWTSRNGALLATGLETVATAYSWLAGQWGCVAAGLRHRRGPFFTALLFLFVSSAISAPTLVWPAPPDEPRISYLHSIGGPNDLGVKRSTIGRIGRWVTGGRPEENQFSKPFALALDEDGNLCVTDTGRGAVGFFDRAHKTWRQWDKVGKIRFSSPVGVVKRGHTFFVADSGLGAVVIFDDKGHSSRSITNGLVRPAGLAIAEERLFVADSVQQCIVKLELDGRLVGTFGKRGGGPGEFNFPTHISSDRSGHVYVTDSMNSRVQVFDAKGLFLRQIGRRGDTPGCFSRPKGAAMDGFGHLYVVDALFDNVQVFDDQGRLLMALGQAGHDLGEFWLPNGIAISASNEIYVADAYNHRVQVFQFTGRP